MDFCNDLNQWTSNLTSEADIPIVHSVSYGWQGNLSKVLPTRSRGLLVTIAALKLFCLCFVLFFVFVFVCFFIVV